MNKTNNALLVGQRVQVTDEQLERIIGRFATIVYPAGHWSVCLSPDRSPSTRLIVRSTKVEAVAPLKSFAFGEKVRVRQRANDKWCERLYVETQTTDVGERYGTMALGETRETYDGQPIWWSEIEKPN